MGDMVEETQPNGSARPSGRARIETSSWASPTGPQAVAPVLRGGRGLKQMGQTHEL